MNTNSTKQRFPFMDEIDRGLNMLVNEVLHPESRTASSPRLSVYEHQDSYVVECDLPGVGLDDITLQLDNGVLEISGERKDPVAEGVTVNVNERSFTAFSRKLQLSKDVDVDRVDAEFGNGVLKVTVPKSDNVRSRQIKIRTADTPSES